jgi:hypothetical protein
MSVWKDYKFTNAYFIDNEKQNIKVIFSDENEEITHIIPFDENGYEWKSLMNVISLDDLHEATVNYIRSEREAFEQTVMLIAKRDGMLSSIVDPTKEVKKWPDIIEKLFNEVNDEDLFALKLAVFEVEKIRASTDTATKTELRKSKTKFDVLRAAFKIIEAIPEIVELVVEKKVTKKK